MAELIPAEVVIDAVAASILNRSGTTSEVSSSSSAAGSVTFLREQVIVVMQLASDILKRTALQNSGSSLLPNHTRPSLSPPPPRWFEAFSQFSRSVASYLWYGPASDSWRTNCAGQESFIDFVCLHPAFRNKDNSVLPARYPATFCESPVVQSLIRGIKRVHGERLDYPKLPITIDILRRLCAATSSDGLHDIVFKAATTVAFAASLRVGEFTIETNASYDPISSTHLSRGSVQFLPDASSSTHFILSLPASRTDPCRKGASILVAAAADEITCPVAIFKTLSDRDPRPASAPLFSSSTPSQPLNQDRFNHFCYIMLSVSGTDIAQHSGLSFRQGATSSAKAMGYSEDEIRLLGR